MEGENHESKGSSTYSPGKKRFINKLTGTLSLIRIYMSIMIGWTAGVGVISGTVSLAPLHLLIAWFSELFIASGGFAFNDYCDINQDKVNAPNNPIPSGRISQKEALIISMAMFFLGLCLSIYFWGTWAPAIALIQLIILIVYSRLKHISGILGNIITALLVGSGFIYGAIISGGIGRIWLPAILTAIFILAREIVKDIPHTSGDLMFKIRSLPGLQGNKTASWIIAGLVLLTILGTLFPYYSLHVHPLYFLLIGIVDLTLIAATLFLLKSPNLKGAKLFLICSAISFPIALLAFTIFRF